MTNQSLRDELLMDQIRVLTNFYTLSEQCLVVQLTLLPLDVGLLRYDLGLAPEVFCHKHMVTYIHFHCAPPFRFALLQKHACVHRQCGRIGDEYAGIRPADPINAVSSS